MVFFRFGAENGARTRDLNLGKVTLYQLSYFRVCSVWDCKVRDKFFLSKFFVIFLIRIIIETSKYTLQPA